MAIAVFLNGISLASISTYFAGLIIISLLRRNEMVRLATVELTKPGTLRC